MEFASAGTNAFLTAGRVLVAVAVRSLESADGDSTLPQHRTLALLAAHGPQRMIDLADLLGVNSSTATRLCDRPQRSGLIRREPAGSDRRSVRVSLTPAGQRLGEIAEARRREIGQVLHAMPDTRRAGVLDALSEFAAAAGEVPDQHWTLGWGTARPATGRRDSPLTNGLGQLGSAGRAELASG